jgi:hypothetical protein
MDVFSMSECSLLGVHSLVHAMCNSKFHYPSFVFGLLPQLCFWSSCRPCDISRVLGRGGLQHHPHRHVRQSAVPLTTQSSWTATFIHNAVKEVGVNATEHSQGVSSAPGPLAIWIPRQTL